MADPIYLDHAATTPVRAEGAEDAAAQVGDVELEAGGAQPGPVQGTAADLGGLDAGTYTLIDYFLKTGLVSNLTLGTQPSGFNYSLVENIANSSIDLLVIPASQALYRHCQLIGREPRVGRA
jgi:hypothetical protein